MTGLRKLHKADLFKIKDNIVESGHNSLLAYESAVYAEDSDTSFTYVKDGKPVACCGAAPLAGAYNLWAVYAAGFSAITRSRAILAFCKKLRVILPDCKGVFSIGKEMPNGAKYAKLIGGTYKTTVDIYEVA